MPPSSTEPRALPAPPRRRRGSISKRRTARGPMPSRRTNRLDRAAPGGCQRHPGRHLAAAAWNWRSQRPCKAPPREQVVSGYPLLNPESCLRRSVPTPGTRRACRPAALNLGPCQLPRGVGVGQFPSGAPLAVPCPHGARTGSTAPLPAAASATRADILPLRRGTGVLSGPARPRHATRWSPDYPLLNPESCLRRSVPTHGTRCPCRQHCPRPCDRLTARTGADHGLPHRRHPAA